MVGGNWCYSEIDNTFITGYYAGFMAGEHSVLTNVFIQTCFIGGYIIGMDHSCTWGRVLIQWCPIGIFALSDKSYITIEMLDIEDSGAGHWYSPTYHITDSNNYMHGYIRTHRVIAGVGAQTNPLTVNGGSNLNIVVI